MGICISRPPALCLAPDPGPQFVFTGPGPQFVFIGPGPKFVFTGPGQNLCLPALVQIFIIRPWSVRSLSLQIPTLSPPNLCLLALAYDFYYGALNLHLPSYL